MAGQKNEASQPKTRTYRQIIRDNIITFFNILNTGLFLAVLLVGSPRNGLFMGTIFFNACIGIIQECRAKRVLDRMAVLTQPKVTVLRDGETASLPVEELVADDIVLLEAGEQVPADALILEGSVEVNEAVLTGESDSLYKGENQELLSGSVVTAGRAWCSLTRVGNMSYASGITRQAKEYRKHSFALSRMMDTILKKISYAILPLGLMLFIKSFWISREGLAASVISTVAAMVGMIPEGLILLISITLAGGAIWLGSRGCLVQEMGCIETLARADVLCLDKTGTLTTGVMHVVKLMPWQDCQGMTVKEMCHILGNMMSVLKDSNATANALRAYFKPRRDMTSTGMLPFSSERKYSAAAFGNEGTWYLGAAEFLFPEDKWQSFRDQCRFYSARGYRVLTLARSMTVLEDGAWEERAGGRLPEDLEPAGFMLLEDVLRREVEKTLAYFADQGVKVMVLSGDAPETVAAIARRAGLKAADCCVDASALRTYAQVKRASRSCDVYGRISPAQKREMVLALQADGHTVGMVGDGVNDILALKEADCSIALGNGSQAAKTLSNIILLDSDFSALPKIVSQGRRIIHNIRMASSMFLIKTIFSILLSIITIFMGDRYPFSPIQMTLISACAVGIPTFFLSQEPNETPVEGHFLERVFLSAFPPAAAITVCVWVLTVIGIHHMASEGALSTACFLVTGWNYMAALRMTYEPLSSFGTVVVYGVMAVFLAAAVLLQGMLGLTGLDFTMIVLVFCLMAFSPLFIRILHDKISVWWSKKE